MKRFLTAFTFLMLCGSCIAPALQAEPLKLRESWQSPYRGEDTKGKHVIALWQFDGKDATVKDISGNGHDLSLADAKIADGGRFGSCLQTTGGERRTDKPHAARAKDHNALSPQGAFSIEMWIKPAKEFNEDCPQAFLIDKKYVSHNDYQLFFGSPNKQGKRCLSMTLGFGNESQIYHSRRVPLETGKWLHLAFVYDGAGRGEFFINGIPWGAQTYPARHSISPGSHRLTIGDRVGSLFDSFPGSIDQVRICSGVREFRPAKIELLSDRKCFVRMEPNPVVRMAVTNLEKKLSAKSTLSISLRGPLATTPGAKSAEIIDKTIELPDLPPGKQVEIDYTIDTSLRPADYQLVADLKVAGKKTIATRSRLDFSIVPRRPPHRFPVLAWGVHGGISKEVDRLEYMGFNHALGMGANIGMIWEAGKPIEADKPERVAKNKAMLDMALRHGITVVSSLSPIKEKRGDKRFWRIGSDGKPLEPQGGHKDRDVCPFFDELTRFSYNVGASMAKTYGQSPAYGAALVHTEVRGNAQPCFHEHDRQAFKKESGLEIPKEIKSKWGVRYNKIKDFPKNRAIDDKNPIYLYYRWYWKKGDGWNQMNTQLTRGLKSTGRKDFWVFTDPAVRVASVYGSGGEVDVISQWTYSYPDPIRIGIATDELLTMAGGASHQQQVMKMTQIIWYRRSTAPIPEKGCESPTYKAGWEVEEAEAPFITIAPMHLREAFWTKIARPIRGIMYHGYQSLVPCESTHVYRFTNEHTHHELARLTHEVLQPLGPTLLNVPGVKSDVALLESLASQVFAGRGAYGWCGNWSGDAHLVAQYAHLQPDIVYDETIIKRGLGGYRVLIMPNCDVITKKMVEAIKKFQGHGGLVVGDENTTPAIKPDIVLKSYTRVGRADKDKAALLALAAELRGKLDAKYSRRVDSSNPNVIPYRRRFKNTDYVFVVNDNREYGQYVGHHGLVMENGLPSEANVSIRRGISFVYDLVENRQVAAKEKDGVTAFDVTLGPCDGRLFMVCDHPIDAVKITVPKSAIRGGKLTCKIAVVGPDDKPIEAVVPLEIAIRDPAGHKTEFSGYWAAIDGRAMIDLDIAPNDAFGIWQIEVRELASGKTSRRYFRVDGPKTWPPKTTEQDKESANPVQPRG